MTTKQKTFNTLRTAAIAAFLGLSSGANALCLNVDGSLDDRSMESAAIDRTMLPACVPEEREAAKTSLPQGEKTEEQNSEPTRNNPTAGKKLKHAARTVSVEGD